MLGCDGADGPQLVNLADWLRDNRPDYDGRHVHAVQLCQNAHTVSGILLFHLTRGEQKRLVQVGSWFGIGNPTSTRSASETHSVDWLVL